MRKEVKASSRVDISAHVAASIERESDYDLDETPASASSAKPKWFDWVAKSAVAASVAFAVVAGVQLTPQFLASDGAPGELATTVNPVPVVAAPEGFDLPSPVARSVSLGSLTEPNVKEQSAGQVRAKPFVNNAQVESELQQLMLEHAELSSENGRFGVLPMARSAATKAQ